MTQMVTITKPCPWGDCPDRAEITVPFAGFAAWQTGTFVQDAFPGLSQREREQIKSGYCTRHSLMMAGIDPDEGPQ